MNKSTCNSPYFLVVIFIAMAFVFTQCSDNDASCIKCELIPEVGPCDAAFPRYYYDQDSMKCKAFIWGGCSGVVPFETLQECLDCGCK
jgi:hypothetical protein